MNNRQKNESKYIASLQTNEWSPNKIKSSTKFSEFSHTHCILIFFTRASAIVLLFVDYCFAIYTQMAIKTQHQTLFSLKRLQFGVIQHIS